MSPRHKRVCFCGMSDIAWIKKKAAGSLYPAQVETTLIQLNAAWPADAPILEETIATFPTGEAALLHLFAVSSVCAARIIRTPAILLCLGQPEVCTRGRSRAEMTGALDRLVEDHISTNNFRALRRWKNQEMTRIALRELAGADLEETTAELSQV